MVHGISSLPLDGSTPASGDGLWQSCVDQLAQELPEQQFNTWIRPLKAELNGDALVLFAPNRFISDWVKTKFLARIQEVLLEVSHETIRVSLEVRQENYQKPGKSETGSTLPEASSASVIP